MRGAQSFLCEVGAVALAFAFVGKGLEDLVSPVGVLFTDQLLLCPWQSSHSAADKGEFKEKLKQSKILFPLKISCVLVVPWRMHLFWHLVPCGISPSPSSQSTRWVWKGIPASWLSWAEDAGAHQLFSRYKESLNVPSCTMQSCWLWVSQHPLQLLLQRWWESVQGPACPAVLDVHLLPLVSVVGRKSGS